MRKIALAFGFKGSLLNNILDAQKILKDEMQIKYMYNNQSLPHITILSGESDNTEAIFNIIKNILLKKFILFSPGLGIFANNKPCLYVRWEKSKDLEKLTKNIIKQISSYFNTINESFNNNLWIAHTTIAMNDLKYENFQKVYNKIQFLFDKQQTIINYLYLIDYTEKETITHSIKLYD